MFESHFVCVVAKFVEVVWADGFVTNIDSGSKAGKINVDPIRIFGFVFKKTRVVHDVGIDGVFKGIGESLFVETLVFMFRKINAEITGWFGSIWTVAGKKGKNRDEEADDFFLQRAEGHYHANLSLSLCYGNFYFFDSAPVSLQDCEAEISACNNIVYFRNLAGNFEDKTCQGVAFTLYLVKSGHRDTHNPAYVVDHRFSFKNIGAVFLSCINNILFVKFIFDISNDLFQNVFKGDDAASASEFVDNHGEMDSFGLKFAKKVLDELLFVHKIGRPHQCAPIKIFPFAKIGKQVLGLYNADNFIKAVSIHGQPRVMQFLDLALQFTKRNLI